jgi:ATP-dependent Clp endopeptidase proteolytic subunit ClpP
MLRRLIKEAVKRLLTIPFGEEEEGEETEEGGRPVIVVKNGSAEAKSEMDLRVIGLFSSVTEEKIAEIITGLIYLNEMNKIEPDPKKRKDIEFYVSTYGGSADDMFALLDIMREAQKTSDIVTIGMGKVMSAGVPILAAGTKGKRKIGANCRVMIHSVAAGNQGELAQMINELEEIKNIQEMYIKILVAHSNMTEDQLRAMLDKGVNVYLTAEEAVKYGIADIIV